MNGKVYVLRHAVSQHNEWRIKKIFKPSLWLQHDSGIIDAQLSEKGIRQAEGLRPKMDTIKFDLVITSPLTRTLQTMKLALGDRKIRTVVTPIVRERADRLSDTGKSLSELERRYKGFEFKHFDDSWKSFDNSLGFVPETKESLMRRVELFKEYLKTQEFESMLLVSHGNFIKHLLKWKIMLPNAYLLSFDKSSIINR